jgi:hypothetical protein
MEGKRPLKEHAVIVDEISERPLLRRRQVGIAAQTSPECVAGPRKEQEAIVLTKAGNDLLPACGPQRRRVLANLEREIDEAGDNRYAADEITNIAERFENAGPPAG